MKISMSLLSIALLFAAACGKKTEEGAKPGPSPTDKATETTTDKVDTTADKEEAKPADKPLTLPADTEIDLSPWGGPFKGMVATAPAGSKVELDEPSRQMKITDTDFLSVGEAPYYADAIAGLAKDKDNSNIQKLSDSEARWERNPPLGKEYNFDIKLTAVKDWDCSGSTFTSPAMADKLVAICKSIKKK